MGFPFGTPRSTQRGSRRSKGRFLRCAQEYLSGWCQQIKASQCFTLKGSHGNKSWRKNDWIPFSNCQLSPFFGYFRGHCQIREIPQNYHRFAWCDPPQRGDSMTPVFTINNLDFTSIQLVILIPARYQSSADPGRVQRWKHGKRNFEKTCERSSQYEVEIFLLPCHIFVGKRIYLLCIANNLWTLKQQRRRSSPLRSPRSWGNFLETAVGWFRL